MPQTLRDVAKAAHALIDVKKLRTIEPRLLAARDEMLPAAAIAGANAAYSGGRRPTSCYPRSPSTRLANCCKC